MIVEQVRAIVSRIRDKANAGDDEAAHELEDALMLSVVRGHAVRGCELSRAALESRRVDFSRWCA